MGALYPSGRSVSGVCDVPAEQDGANGVAWEAREERETGDCRQQNALSEGQGSLAWHPVMGLQRVRHAWENEHQQQ